MTLRHSLRPLVLSIGCLVLAAGCGTEFLTSPSDGAGSPVDSFSSSLAPGGTASRSYVMETPGTLMARLSSTTPDGVVLGLGIGIPQGAGAGCSLTVSVQTAAGPTAQVSIATDAGAYCIQLYDLGTLTEPLPFTLSFSRQ